MKSSSYFEIQRTNIGGLLKILKVVVDDLKLVWILWNDFKYEGLGYIKNWDLSQRWDCRNKEIVEREKYFRCESLQHQVDECTSVKQES